MDRGAVMLSGVGALLVLPLLWAVRPVDAAEPDPYFERDRPDIIKSLGEEGYPTDGWLSTETMTSHEEGVVEAVFRRQFERLRPGDWKLFCLYTHTHFPPRSLLQRFADHDPRVVPSKRCYRGNRVMRFGASWIRPLEDGHVLVVGGYDGRTEVYEVVRSEDTWEVVRVHTLFVA